MIASAKVRSLPGGPHESGPSRVALLALDRVGFKGTLTYLLQSTAMFVQGCRTSVWMHGENPAQFDAARNLICEIMRDRLHVRLLLSSASPATVEYLRNSFPDDQVCPVPWNLGPVVRRFTVRVNPSVILLLDGGRTLGTKVLARALHSRIPVRAVNLATPECISPQILRALASGPADIQFCLQSRESADRLRALGVRPEALFVTGSLDFEPGRPALSSSPESLRTLLGLGPGDPVVIATEILPQQEAPVLGAFADIKRLRPDARLVLEPKYRSRGLAILKQVREKGWTGDRRTRQLKSASAGSWDVLLADVPGEIPAFITIACAAYIGDAVMGKTSGPSVATAIAAGCPSVSDPIQNSVYDSQPPGAVLSDMIRSGNRVLSPATLLDRHATRNTMDVIRPCLPGSLRIPRFEEAARLPTFRDKVGRSHLWNSVARAFMGRRIDDWGSLRERLLHPQSVLCLGNGPSCEDPRVQEYSHDCLIRVNWRWRARGILTKPNMVFVGDAATIHKVPPCIFGIWNTRLEYAMLLRHAVTHGLKRMEYVTMDRVSPIIRDYGWQARPSNGALMVVAGAALNPQRLIIAGMDLFQHRDGRYPGDVRSNNQYAHVHSRQTDLEIIHLALERFRGEVIILSDILRDSLTGYRSGAVCDV